MIENPEELENTLHQLEITQKILLFSSVERLPEKEKSPLGIIKKILIELFQEEFNQKPKTATIPCKKIGAVSLFRIISGEMQKECLLPNLLLLKIGNTNQILYPFTEKIIDDIESGICLYVSVKMQLKTKQYITPVKKTVRTIQISGTLQYPVEFEGNDGTIITSIYTYSLNRFYDDDDIIFFSGLPTFCMYPDIPFEYETNCQQYTYFFNRDSRLPIAIHEDVVDLKKMLHLDIDCESSGLSYITTRIGKVAFMVTKTPRHLIKVIYDNQHEKRVVGSILNLRTIAMQYPPLLGQEKEICFSLKRPEVNISENIISVYMDFGSSSSVLGYRFNGADMSTFSVTGGTPVVRDLLAAYDKRNYCNFINLSSETSSCSEVPSVCLKYNAFPKDRTPFHMAWHPFQYRFADFAKHLMIPEESGKLLFANGQSVNAGLILYNLCYTAVCHAINQNSRKVYLFPVFSGKKYLQHLNCCLNQIIDELTSTFPEIEIVNFLNAKNIQYLYESMAYSVWKIRERHTNFLAINVNIGDTITDMSAIQIDEKGKKMCAYSSVEYAGRMLLKAAVRDMLSHTQCEKKAEAFLLHLFRIHESQFSSDKVRVLIKGICQKFFPNSKRAGRPRDASWQAMFDELLKTTPICIENADIKFQADLRLRYATLIRVVRDFTETAVNLCDCKKFPVMKLYFSGGASAYMTEQFLNLVRTDFNHYFFQDTINCFTEVISTNKCDMIRLLKNLSFNSLEDGYILLDNANIMVNWQETNTENISSIIQHKKRMSACTQFGFRTDNSYEAEKYNKQQLKKQFSEQILQNTWINYCRELIDGYIQEEALSGLLKDCFLLNFRKRSVYNELLLQLCTPPDKNGAVVTSLKYALDSEVYPEMLHSTAYMFAVSHLLSKYFGAGFSGEPMTIFLTTTSISEEDYLQYYQYRFGRI